MFERFTERARQVIILAQDEARHAGHDVIAPMHVFIGLIREEEGLAARVLEEYGVTLQDARTHLYAPMPKKKSHNRQQIPFTEEAKKGLECALREALALGNNYIGTEHLLLAFDRLNDDTIRATLSSVHVSSDELRVKTINMMMGPKSRRTTQEPPSSDTVEDKLRDVFSAMRLAGIDKRALAKRLEKYADLANAIAKVLRA